MPAKAGVKIAQGLYRAYAEGEIKPVTVFVGTCLWAEVESCTRKDTSVKDTAESWAVGP